MRSLFLSSVTLAAMMCPVLAQDAAPVEQPALDEEASIAIINGDVDLYVEPGGVGSPSGMIEEGTEVNVVQCREDNWCLIDEGWVWGDFLNHM